jgi:hypothetical protein
MYTLMDFERVLAMNYKQFLLILRAYEAEVRNRI